MNWIQWYFQQHFRYRNYAFCIFSSSFSSLIFHSLVSIKSFRLIRTLSIFITFIRLKNKRKWDYKRIKMRENWVYKAHESIYFEFIWCAFWNAPMNVCLSEGEYIKMKYDVKCNASDDSQACVSNWAWAQVYRPMECIE